MSISYQEMKIF